MAGTHRAALALIGAVTVGWTVSLGPTTAFASDQETAVIEVYIYVPMSLTVKAGTTVTINMDDEPHTVASDTGPLRSGDADTNETYSFKFHKPGVYRVRRSIHSRMVATINVE